MKKIKLGNRYFSVGDQLTFNRVKYIIGRNTYTRICKCPPRYFEFGKTKIKISNGKIDKAIYPLSSLQKEYRFRYGYYHTFN